jgi:competence protein ComEA
VALGGAAGGVAIALLGFVVLAAPDAGPAVGPGQAPDGAIGPLGAPAALLEGTSLSGAGLTVGVPRDDVVVDVGGAVLRPGLRRLREGSRVADAIEAAGGFGPRVDLAATALSLNLAEPLTDGGKVVVPELGLAAAIGPAPGDARIDLNQADQAALESLPGIGPVTAEKILSARAAQRFAAVADLIDRGLVGQAVYEDIVDLVRVAG